MEAKQAMAIPLQITDSSVAIQLSVAIIDANDQHRREVANALAGFQGTTVREYSAFPANLDDLPQMMEKHYDAVIIGLDSDPECAFDLVESLCDNNSTTVMVYTEQTQLEQAVRFMRAGAREYLTLPLARAEMAGALARISIRRSATSHGKRVSRKLFVFLGGERRLRSDHHLLEFRRGAGPGVRPADPVDRLGTSPGRRGAQPGDDPSVLDHQRSVGLQPAGCEFLPLAAGQA